MNNVFICLTVNLLLFNILFLQSNVQSFLFISCSDFFLHNDELNKKFMQIAFPPLISLKQLTVIEHE